MGLRIDASGDTLSRSSAATFTSFTLCGWCQVVSDLGANTWQNISGLDASANALISFGWSNNDGSASTMEMGSWNGTTWTPVTFGSRPAVGDWFFWYLKCAGTGANQLEGGWRRLQDTSYVTATTTLGSGLTGSASVVLSNERNSFYLNGRHAAVKGYSTALSAAEIERERLTIAPQSTTNLSFWLPMVNASVTDAVKDFSGAGANFTAGGTLTIEGGPPIAYKHGRRTLVLPATATGPTGTLVVTETADTAAFAGDVVVSGTLASTEGVDTASFAGQVVISAALAVTEGTDTASFAGAVGTSGSLAVTETADIAAFAGDVIVSGSLAVTEGQDTAAFSGSVVVSGSLAVTEGQDTAAFSGSVIVSGSLSATENTDAAAFVGTVGNVVSGTLAATETADTASFAGSVIVSGSLIATEGADTAAFSGSVVVSGSLVVTEGQDTAVFDGTIASTVTGTLEVTESPDVTFFYEQTGGGIWRWKEGMEALHVKRNAPTMPPEFKKAAQVMSSAGGHARAASLTPKQRTVIARNAAQARWK